MIFLDLPVQPIVDTLPSNYETLKLSVHHHRGRGMDGIVSIFQYLPLHS